MKYLSLLVLVSGISASTQAKVWRLNNNVGVSADFTTIVAAYEASRVNPGDTLYLEPSAVPYHTNGSTLPKKLIFIGPGYFLDVNNTSWPGNAGLQISKETSIINGLTLGTAASGSQFLGVQIDNGINMVNTSDIVFERVLFNYNVLRFSTGTMSNITVRKCFFAQGGITYTNGVTASRVTIENNIFQSANLYIAILTGSENIIRNNTIFQGGSVPVSATNAYFVNNIIGGTGASSLTDCTIKNNFFQFAQVLPGTATNNKVSQNMTDMYVGTGSYDARLALSASSPARGAGLTVGSVVSPDCGAFGGTNPYKLSGIPNIPTIYTFTAPVSIPTGTPTMNVTFSTRNNN